MHFLYIIYSPSADKFYIGETNDVPARVKLHNSYKTIKKLTKAHSDWELKRIFKCKNREEAVFLQAYLQEQKGRKVIQQVIMQPEILKEILERNNR